MGASEKKKMSSTAYCLTTAVSRPLYPKSLSSEIIKRSPDKHLRTGSGGNFQHHSKASYQDTYCMLMAAVVES